MFLCVGGGGAVSCVERLGGVNTAFMCFDEPEELECPSLSDDDSLCIAICTNPASCC